MRSRAPLLSEPGQLMNTAQIFRESIRILLLYPNHFNSISFFLFSPLPVCLFTSHLLIHHLPTLSSTTLDPISHFFEDNGIPSIIPKLVFNSIFSVIICLPSSITFSLIGKAVTIRAVVHIYNGKRLSNKRLLITRGTIWVKLLHTCFWEYLIILCLIGVLVACLAAIPIVSHACLSCSSFLRLWASLSLLGIPLCVGFANVVVIGNLARVVSVVEGDCHGLESLVKAKDLISGRRQTALLMALLSNGGMRLVEGLFEFRMHQGGMHMWEGYILVSMYSSVLVLETIMNVVFYYSCKPVL